MNPPAFRIYRRPSSNHDTHVLLEKGSQLAVTLWCDSYDSWFLPWSVALRGVVDFLLKNFRGLPMSSV